MKTQKHVYYIGQIAKNILKVCRLKIQLFLIRNFSFDIEKKLTKAIK